MSITRSPLRLSGAALLLAALPITTAMAAEVVATVNGEAIVREDVERYKQAHATGAKQGVRSDKQIIDELVARELVLQDATKKGLAAKPAVKAELEEARRNILLNAAIEDALAKQPITQEELEALYAQQAAQFNATEYHARHILVEDKAKAEALIKQLKEGADFAELAKEHSTGPTGKNGGDLGWFAPQQMVPPFSQALQGLKKGEITETPVQTQFGWHVIELQDTRKPEPPTLEQVKPQLQNALQQRHIAQYLDGLRNAAEVDIK